MTAVTFGPLEVPTYIKSPPFKRADLKFIGVDHSWSSFEARVFLNNAKADETAPKDAARGYVGSFYIFGHGGCFGDEGHCDWQQQPASVVDRRRPHQLTPTTKLLIVTDALKRILDAAAGPTASVTITVVPVVRASALAKPEDAATVLSIRSVQVLTYD